MNEQQKDPNEEYDSLGKALLKLLGLAVGCILLGWVLTIAAGRLF